MGRYEKSAPSKGQKEGKNNSGPAKRFQKENTHHLKSCQQKEWQIREGKVNLQDSKGFN